MILFHCFKKSIIDESSPVEPRFLLTMSGIGERVDAVTSFRGDCRHVQNEVCVSVEYSILGYYGNCGLPRLGKCKKAHSWASSLSLAGKSKMSGSFSTLPPLSK